MKWPFHDEDEIKAVSNVLASDAQIIGQVVRLNYLKKNMLLLSVHLTLSLS